MRKTKLVECNPKWVEHEGATCGVTFDCPEGHEGCLHTIPFSPSLNGKAVPTWQSNGAQWQRVGDTFDTLTLQPSIRRIPVPDYDACALHIFISKGEIQFCGDSR